MWGEGRRQLRHWHLQQSGTMEFKLSFHHFLALWLWASYLLSLSLFLLEFIYSVLIFKALCQA